MTKILSARSHSGLNSHEPLLPCKLAQSSLDDHRTQIQDDALVRRMHNSLRVRSLAENADGVLVKINYSYCG